MNTTRLTDEEWHRLQKLGIKTTDDLWSTLGTDHDYDTGIQNLSNLTKISEGRLTIALAAEALHEAKEGIPLEQNFWHSLQKHWLDLLLIAGIVAVVLLVVQALLFRLVLGTEVVVAKHSLETGQVLREEDFTTLRLNMRPGYITVTQDLAGSILAQDVLAGRPLRVEDVSRLQAVASVNILDGTLINRGMFTMTLTSYQPDAVSQLSQVEGQIVEQDIPSGQVILAGTLGPPPPSTVTALTATHDLPAFVALTETSPITWTPATLTVDEALKGVKDRYPLEDISANTSVSTGTLSEACVADVNLQQEIRVIMTLPVQEGAASAVERGDCISVLLIDQDDSDNRLELDNVIVLEAISQEGISSINAVLAMTLDQYGELQELIGHAAIFLLQPIP